MVMNILCKYKFAENIVYNTSRRALSYEMERLYRRGLVRLSGEDAVTYLQGLITNDVNLVDRGNGALFTYFLNNKGRILFDALIYKRSQCDILLECDMRIRDDMIEHLKMYRVRKKVKVEPFNGNVWSIFTDMIPSSNLEVRIDKFDLKSNYNKIVYALCRRDVITFQDPRVPSLGVRIFALPQTSLTDILQECGIRTVESNDYVVLRYKLGIPEGISEIPAGKCFPLEMNCDYLNGVSFQKGCYIGQELTARTFHTGVIRKRIMPLILSSVPDREIDYDSVIVTEDDQIVGKLKGIKRNYCIALLRISETLKNPVKLNLNGISAYTYQPFWWPLKENNLPEDSIS